MKVSDQSNVGVDLVVVGTAMRVRRRRADFLNSQLFADPAWDMLLELFFLALEQRRTSVSKLGGASGVPAATALRWIGKLESEGLIVRKADPMDARRLFVQLSSDGEAAMRRYFEALPPGAVLV